MRKWKLITLASMVIIVGILIISIFIIPGSKENFGLIEIVNGENTIYLDTNASSNKNFSIDSEYLLVNGISFNNKNISKIVDSLLINGKQDYTFQHVAYHKYITLAEALYIKENNEISYYNNTLENTLLNEKDILNKSEVEKRAIEIIKTYNENYKDLHIVEQFNPKLYKADLKTGEETLLGYTGQVIIFRQYISGYEVKGEKGTIILTLSNNGTLKSLIDKTLQSYKIQKTSLNIKDSTTQIQCLSNKAISIDEKSFILNGIKICFYFSGSDNLQGSLNYEFCLKGRSTNYEYTEYVDCFF